MEKPGFYDVALSRLKRRNPVSAHFHGPEETGFLRRSLVKVQNEETRFLRTSTVQKKPGFYDEALSRFKTKKPGF